MTPINYLFSMIHGKWAFNRVRFCVESKLRLTYEKTGHTEDYFQCASCKSEDTFAKKNLFYADNYDFTPVFGPEYGIIFRRKAAFHDQYKSCPRTEEMWEGPEYALREEPGAVLLGSDADICRYTHKNVPLVAQTELYNSETGLRAVIEYPIKTMNINDEHRRYQVDTGPVLLPDLTLRAARAVDSIRLAYVAFNTDSFADFVTEQPTGIAEGTACRVLHYTNPVSLPAVNRIYAIV